MQRCGDAVEALEFTDRGHSWTAAGSRADDGEGLGGALAADPVDVEPAVALEILEGSGGQRSEDPVDPPAVEPELAEHRLQRADVVTAQVGGQQLERAVTETP